MKMTIRATDKLNNNKVEFGCNIPSGKDFNVAFNAICSQRKGREHIIKELKLYIGEAKLELISEGRVIATGTMSYNMFSGRGNVETEKCVSYPA